MNLYSNNKYERDERKNTQKIDLSLHDSMGFLFCVLPNDVNFCTSKVKISKNVELSIISSKFEGNIKLVTKC